MALSRPITEEEANLIKDFLALPFDYQRKTWPLLSKRNQYLISLLEMLQDGPVTYADISLELNITSRYAYYLCNSFFVISPPYFGVVSGRIPPTGGNGGPWIRTWQIDPDPQVQTQAVA